MLFMRKTSWRETNDNNKIIFPVCNQSRNLDSVMATSQTCFQWTENYQSYQKYSILRCLLHVKSLVIWFYLGWSGSILQIRTNVIKVGSKLWLFTCSSDITLNLPSYAVFIPPCVSLCLIHQSSFIDQITTICGS